MEEEGTLHPENPFGVPTVTLTKLKRRYTLKKIFTLKNIYTFIYTFMDMDMNVYVCMHVHEYVNTMFAGVWK